MARVEQGHLPMMVNVRLVAFVTDNAIDFVSDCPELGLLWCFFFHAINLSELCEKSRDFFRGIQGCRNPTKTLATNNDKLFSNCNNSAIYVQNVVIEALCQFLFIFHAYTLPQDGKKARDFLSFLKLFLFTSPPIFEKNSYERLNF